MFREIILPIFRSTRLCVTACGVMHPPRCCRPSAGNIYQIYFFFSKSLVGFSGNKLNIEFTKQFVIKPRRNTIQATDVCNYRTEETLLLEFAVTV